MEGFASSSVYMVGPASRWPGLTHVLCSTYHAGKLEFHAARYLATQDTSVSAARISLGGLFDCPALLPTGLIIYGLR